MNISRFEDKRNSDNTMRILDNIRITPAFVATLNLVPTAHRTLVHMLLTGNMTVNIDTGSATKPPMIGDTVDFLLTSDATSRTVTFGTGIQSAASTFVITTAKFAIARFMFNGVNWQETGRTITA